MVALVEEGRGDTVVCTQGKVGGTVPCIPAWLKFSDRVNSVQHNSTALSSDFNAWKYASWLFLSDIIISVNDYQYNIY